MQIGRHHITITADPEEMSRAAAVFWMQRALEAVAARGRFVVALSGGSGPRRLFELLAHESEVDWAHWHVFWVDDRVVAPEDPESNFGLANRTLLAHVPIPADQIHRVPTGAGSSAAAAEAYEADIRRFFAQDADPPRFDFMQLGLGGDGHVASLFPGFPTLDEDRRLAVSSPPGTLPPPIDRVTLTFPVINAARTLMFIVSDGDKADVLSRVIGGERALPAARVDPTDGELHWFIDEAAAARLPGR